MSSCSQEGLHICSANGKPRENSQEVTAARVKIRAVSGQLHKQVRPQLVPLLWPQTAQSPPQGGQLQHSQVVSSRMECEWSSDRTCCTVNPASRGTACSPQVLTSCLPAKRFCWAPLLRGRPGPGAGATAVNKAGRALAFKELPLQGGEAAGTRTPQ